VLLVELQIFTVLKLNVTEPFFSFSNMNEQAVQFNIRFSQGSAATYFRCVGRSYAIFIYTSMWLQHYSTWQISIKYTGTHYEAVHTLSL